MMVRFSPPSEFNSGTTRSGVYPAGQREGRFPERLPAASIGSAQAWCFIPSKAIGSRNNSVLAPASASTSPGRLTVSREGRETALHAPPAPNPFGRGPVGLGGVSADRPASGARGTRAGSIYRSMKRFSSASKRLLMSARSALESGEFAQTLFDIFAVGFLAAFASLLGLSIVGAFVILFSAWVF